ncbi:nucleotidyltransferase domain-containing protein [Candidatus Saccharibacteria bacterium]|nr:nucleotidyltransferase domain-containing protein [Candidatus Saccharibacteria bacterium]
MSNQTEKKITKIAWSLINKGALSVFLYGSRVIGDALANSDWELGVIFEDTKYVQRSKLAALAPEGISIYPFKLSDITNADPETPFIKSVWMNEIIRTAKTIAGQDIVSTIPAPEITKEDLAKDIAFHKARALDAMLAKRHEHEELAKNLFVKSCLFGLRDLILQKGGDFPTSYKEISENAEKYLPEEYKKLSSLALSVRNGEAELTLDLTFKNIGLFTEVIEFES